jgi:hypothetical protein
VFFDNARIDLHVPIRHVHVAHTFYLPNVELPFRTVQREPVASMVML